jgi:molecular chaperone Hsp33
MAGEGRLTVSVETLDLAARYQGIVPLAAGGLAECLEAYFRDSEQLPTRIWLASTPAHAAGLLLQRLPGSVSDAQVGGEQEDPQEAWTRVEHLARTLRPEELLTLPQRDVMRRLFHEEDVRVFEPAPVFFQCRCSRERVIELLRALGEEEIRGIVAERGAVQARCEFCNREYEFDAIDAEQLFRAHADVTRSGMLQ